MKTTRHIRVITALVVALLLVVGMAEASLAQAAAEQEGAPVMEENEAQTPSVPGSGSEGTTPGTGSSEDKSDVDSDAPTAPPAFSDLAPKIEGPKEVVPGDEIEVTISTVAEGTDSPLETAGLEFISTDSDLCHESYMILIPGVPNGENLNKVTYKYRVAADASEVSIKLKDLHIAVENPPDNVAALPPLSWTVPVVDRIPETARALRSRGHYFDFAGDSGFLFAVMDDGTPALKGLPVARKAATVSSYAEKLIAPNGGSIRFVGADGTELAADDAVYSGCIIEALDKEGRVLEEATLVVRGDLLGTGKAGIKQLSALTDSTRGGKELTPLQAMAADHNDNFVIDMKDIRMQSDLLLG